MDSQAISRARQSSCPHLCFSRSRLVNLSEYVSNNRCHGGNLPEQAYIQRLMDKQTEDVSDNGILEVLAFPVLEPCRVLIHFPDCSTSVCALARIQRCFVFVSSRGSDSRPIFLFPVSGVLREAGFDHTCKYFKQTRVPRSDCLPGNTRLDCRSEIFPKDRFLVTPRHHN